MAYFKYKDQLGYWRWRIKAANGRIIADSGESYVSEGDCDHGIALVKGSGMAPVYKQ